MADAENGGKSPILPVSRRQRLSGRRQTKDRKRFRLLVACLVTGIVATILLLAAMATTDWVEVQYPNGLYRRSSSAYVQRQVSGLFRLCRFECDNSSVPVVHREYCRMVTFFRPRKDGEDDNAIDSVILDYARTGAAFSIIALVLSSGANFFTWYSINEPRYMFKRVAGSLHLISAATVLICLEVFRNSLQYARSHLPDRFPADARVRFGASYGVAWASTALYAIVGVGTFLLSGKRKGERAYSVREAMENEPVHLGRM